MTSHAYAVRSEWTGDRGSGTSGDRDYDRTVVLRAAGKPALPSSADRAFRGEPDRWNPEDLLVAALSECHLLSYLHAAVNAGLVVTGYTDEATGELEVDRDGAGRIVRVDLAPRVVLADETARPLADALHAEAHRMCFLANSVSFPVRVQPVLP